MKISNNFKFWKLNQPVSYVNINHWKTKLHHFDMGESLLSKNSVPYPDSSQRLIKQQISQFLNVLPNMVSLGCGTDELIELIPRIFLNPGDKVLVITPTFFRFLDASLRIGARIVSVKTILESSFEVTEKIVQEVIAVTKLNEVKLVWLCSPNHPTGIEIPEQLIVKIVLSNSCMVVVDQAFKGFSPLTRLLKQLADSGENLICLRSLSKISGLAGLRIGCAVAKSEIIELLESWRLPFNISKLSHNAFLTRSETIIKNERKHITKINQERTRLFTNIKILKNLEIGAPSQSNIFLLRHKSKDLFVSLLKERILAADFRQALGLEGLGFVRITLKSRRENERLLKALNLINVM